ncbi:hypothetical protein DPMN_074680 [Dreissena polymorpha]|uniref:Uncharacterized protein n=1 Tax=Dreissena polymorpha TaxID=45954 RepID=A0A9D4BE94_DREPO|nr:hypothetical protein DPMN_074680 [Dreissena polymorpha]
MCRDDRILTGEQLVSSSTIRSLSSFCSEAISEVILMGESSDSDSFSSFQLHIFTDDHDARVEADN